MRVKRYTGKTLQEAMQKVKMDMGKEAVILHTKKFKEGGFLGFFGKVMFEVTAAIEEMEIKPRPLAKPLMEAAVAAYSKPEPEPAKVPSPPPSEGKSYSELENEIKEMKNLLTEMVQKVELIPEVKNLPQTYQRFFHILTMNEVDQRLTQKLLHEILKQVPNPEEVDSEEVKKSLEEQILKLLKKAKPVFFKRKTLNQQIIALVGPTGVGKTTTLAKLAANFSIVDKKKVCLITADTFRVAAVEQLKTYGEIIGIPVEVVYTPQELREAVDNNVDKDLILIDTAGRSHKNPDQMNELQRFLDVSEVTDIFLVLSATTKYSDMIEIVRGYGDIAVSRIVFTKLDETSTFGSILNIIHETQKNLSYVTMGQSVPDDIEVADPVKIAKNITKER